MASLWAVSCRLRFSSARFSLKTILIRFIVLVYIKRWIDLSRVLGEGLLFGQLPLEVSDFRYLWRLNTGRLVCGLGKD